MLRKFQIDLVYRLGAKEKTSFYLIKIQRHQLEGASLNVETNSCSLDLAKGYLHQNNKPHISHQTSMHPHKQMEGHTTSQQPHSPSRYMTRVIPLIA